MAMRKMVPGLAALLLIVVVTSATAARDTAKGSFAAHMQLGSGNSAMDRKFDGTLAWAKPKLRLDLKDKATKESMVVLVDFTGGDATLLYPDTLNGFKTKLPAVDTAGYILQFQQLLSSGGQKMEKGWSKEKVGSEKVGAASATKYKVTGPKGEIVYWWTDSKNTPLRVSSGQGNNKVTLDFGSLSFGADVPASTFSYGKDYTVLEFQGQPNVSGGKSKSGAKTTKSPASKGAK